MGYKKEDEEIKMYKDFPYGIIGHSCLLPDFEICLSAEAIKKIAELMKEKDLLKIKVFAGTKASEFKIARWEED